MTFRIASAILARGGGVTTLPPIFKGIPAASWTARTVDVGPPRHTNDTGSLDGVRTNTETD
ncbi:MAG: hypothetical protein AAFV88_03650 [Planctomycetota bacterium]